MDKWKQNNPRQTENWVQPTPLINEVNSNQKGAVNRWTGNAQTKINRQTMINKTLHQEQSNTNPIIRRV